MNRKIGDRVKIISSDKSMFAIGFVEYMKKYCGRVATIKKILWKDYYRIDIDDQSFLWGDDMFEKEVKGLLKNE